MPFSSIYKIALKLKGRGHFLSPKEVKFLKELLEQFSEEEIKLKLEKCYKQFLPPKERGKVPLTRCRPLFQKKTGERYLNKNEHLPTLKEVIGQLPRDVKLKIYRDLKKLKREKDFPVKGRELEELLILLIRKYT